MTENSKSKLVAALVLIVALAGCDPDVTGGVTVTAEKDAAPWSMVDQILATIELPNIPDVEFVITDFGAVADDGQDDRQAILDTIAAAVGEGGGRVVLPAGTWDSAGPVVLASRIDFHLAEGATLLFSPRAADYLPVVSTRWEGIMMQGYSPLIYAADVEDVAITGKGLIDGNADSEFHTWNRAEDKRQLAHDDVNRLRQMGVDGVPASERVFGEGTHLRPSALQLLGARRVLLEDYTIRNSPFWVNHIVFTTHATMRGVTVDSHFGNNDGIDVDSSSYVLIENNHFRTGDDSVVVKSGRDRDGREVGVASEYIVVRNNDMGGEDGIGLGSEMSGDVRYVFFDNNVLRKGSAAFRFKANLERGGVVEHIRVRGFEVEEFRDLFWFQLKYPGEFGGNFPATYRDIVFENINVEKVGNVIVANAPVQAPLKDVLLRNVSIGEAENTFVLENVEQLTFENVTIDGQQVNGELSWRAAK